MCIANNNNRVLNNMSRKNKKHSLKILPLTYKPGANDILCGRGNVSSNHEGNKNFGRIIRANLRTYQEAPNRSEKIRVVDVILQEIRLSGALFAKIDSETKRWHELDPVQAHQKIGHAIRDTIRLLKGKDWITKPITKTKTSQIVAKRKRRLGALMQRNNIHMLPSSDIRQNIENTEDILQMSFDTAGRLNDLNTIWSDDENVPPVPQIQFRRACASTIDPYRLEDEYPEESFDFSPLSFFGDFRRTSQ